MKKTALTAFLCGILSSGFASANPFNFALVADNDYAILSGTSTGINNLLYDNDGLGWPEQIAAAGTPISVELAPGDDTFYLLAIGYGSTQDNLSGEVNGQNITDANLSVRMSSDLRPFLAVNSDPLLSEVMAAFSSLTWESPVINSTEHVINASGFGQGFDVEPYSVRLFSFEAENVPEPSMLAMLAAGLVGMFLRARRRAFVA